MCVCVCDVQSGNDNALTVNNVLTTSDGHYEISGEYNLTVVNVSVSDENQYTCEAGGTNYVGSLTAVGR